MKKTITSKEILKLLPTNKESAVSKYYLAEKLEIPPTTVGTELKRMRLGWLPILWNCNWVYIDYAKNAIQRQSRIIENMKVWYMNWMTNIQNVFKDIIAWKHGKI